MRILYLSHGYPPTVSGVSLVVQKLARALVRAGHQMTVVTASERRTPYQADDQGVRLIRIRSTPNLFWKEGPIPWISLGYLRKIIQEFQPDVVHTHENVILSSQLIRLSGSLRAPLVSSCYFLPRYVTHYLGGRAGLDAFIERSLWTYAVRNLNHYQRVIFSTRTQEQAFIDHGLTAQSQAISNGVDAGRYRPGDEGVDEIEKRYQLPDGPRILFVSRLMKDKKIDILIRALPEIVNRTNAHLLLVGRGDERENLEALTAKLNLQSQVHFLGFVPEDDLPAIYRASDLFAMASIVEVQSIPTLQALVTGLPVVLVNAAALPELVRDGVNGYLLPPEDPQAFGCAFEKLLADPALAAQMGQASLAIGAGHAEAATFKAYDDLYRSLAGNR